MKRPYIAHSIEQLEAVFDDQGTAQDALNDLAQELSYRRTARARALAERVTERLAVVPRHVTNRPASQAKLPTEPPSHEEYSALPIGSQPVAATAAAPSTSQA